MHRFLLISAAIVLGAAGVASAAILVRGGGDVGLQPVTPPTVVALPDAVAEPVPMPTADPVATATATPAATAQPTPTETAAEEVAMVQQRLTDLRYYVGPIDGEAGPGTASAVQAFQKVNGLSADGVIGPNTVAALSSPVVPALRGGGGDRVEVDLDLQVMYLVRSGQIDRILPISSGSGERYTTSSGPAESLTPVGTFTVQRHIRGERHAELGTLYDPMYFHGGWAIHGSNSVPAYPASHGCVRVTRADAKWLFDRLPIGSTVQIYGNTNAFSPAAGETAGTSTPAGDTADTTPDDGIQNEAPAPTPTPSPTATTPPPAPAPAPEPAQPTPAATAQPTQPAPSAEPSAQTAPPPPEPATGD